MKLTKKQQTWKNLDTDKVYALADAIEVLREYASKKFDETLEIAIRLGIDVTKADQNIRGMLSLPNGTGKSVRVAVFTANSQDEAKKAGATGTSRTPSAGTSSPGSSSRGFCPVRSLDVPNSFRFSSSRVSCRLAMVCLRSAMVPFRLLIVSAWSCVCCSKCRIYFWMSAYGPSAILLSSLP